MAVQLFPVAMLPAIVTKVLNMQNNKIVNLAPPSSQSDAARLADVKAVTVPVLNSAGAIVHTQT